MILIYCILILLLSSVISLLGSIQLGPVNIAVIHRSIAYRYKEAVLIGLGGALPELLYSFLAMKGSEFLEQYPHVLRSMYWISIPLFLLIGVYFLFKKAKSEIKTTAPKETSTAPLFIGLLLGGLNPMILPFWIVVITTFNSFGIDVLDSGYYKASFIIGTMLGAFALQLGLIALIKNFRARFEKIFVQYSNPVTGGMFVVIGLAQLIRQLI